MTVLGIFIRLATILRDIAKAPCAITHRGLDLQEVYLNANNKVLLGGFYYAHAPSFNGIPEYLPESPRYLQSVYGQGQKGSAATDTQVLARMLYNLFAGVPWDAAWNTEPFIAPEYAPPELLPVLQMGLRCAEDECNAFRKSLMACYKQLNKQEGSQIMLPIRRQLQKEFSVEYAETKPGCPDGNTTNITGGTR